MATVIKTHIHAVGDELIAVSDGENGQVMRIPSEKAVEIRKLMAERHRIGLAITAQLNSIDMWGHTDDETVMWNSVG